MNHLICPYCGKVLAKRYWWDCEISFCGINGEGWSKWEKLFHFFTGCILEPYWRWFYVDGPCPCEPPLA